MEVDPNLGIVTIILMTFTALAAQFGDVNYKKREEEKEKKKNKRTKKLKQKNIRVKGNHLTLD
jgi:hypothetical protein